MEGKIIDDRENVFGSLLPNTSYRVAVSARVLRDGIQFDSPIGSTTGFTSKYT